MAHETRHRLLHLRVSRNHFKDTPHELDAVCDADQVDPGALRRHCVHPVLPQLPAGTGQRASKCLATKSGQHVHALLMIPRHVDSNLGHNPVQYAL